jgi:peptidoglycan/LPS O-acetylase OafA/YrhL
VGSESYSLIPQGRFTGQLPLADDPRVVFMSSLDLSRFLVHPLTPSPQASEPVPATERSAVESATLPEEQIVTGNTSHTRPENRAFYPALDGMRAIAFLMVFFAHYCGMPWGWAGVDLFFVLSGFLITGILFDSRDDPHRVRNFYVRRTLRIFPLYYGVLLLLLPFVYRQLTWSWLVWPAYLGNYARFFSPYAPGSSLQIMADVQPYLQTSFLKTRHITVYLGHFWSLCVEEQFYLVWPWIVFWIRDRRRLLWICAASVPICLAARLAGQSLLPTWMLDQQILYRATPFRFDALLLGGCLALSLRGPGARVLLRAARLALPLTLTALFLWCLSTPAHFWRHQPDRYPAWTFTWGLLGIDVLSALIIVAAIQPRLLIYRALNQRALRWLGRISYGAYVLHDIPHHIYLDIARIVAPTHVYAAVVGIALISTCILSWLSYRFFESPFLNLKERWTIRS